MFIVTTTYDSVPVCSSRAGCRPQAEPSGGGFAYSPASSLHQSTCRNEYIRSGISLYVGCERAAAALQSTVALCSAAAPQSYDANFTVIVYYMRASEEEHLADERALAPCA